MKDSNDGSGGALPEAPASEPVASIPVSVSVTDTADEESQLPPLPPGVMKPATAAKTGAPGVSLVPSTEPSVELAARSRELGPPPGDDPAPASVSSEPVAPSEPPESAPSVLQVLAPHL